MKKTITLFWLIAAAAFVFSCSKEKVETTPAAENNPAVEAGVDKPASDGNLLTSFGAVLENAGQSDATQPASAPRTKVAIDVSYGTQSFEDGDEVLVVSGNKSATYTYDGTSGKFGVADPADAVPATDAKVYYPASEFVVSGSDVTFTMPAAIAAGSAEDLGDKVPMAGLVNTTGAEPAVEFKNLGSIFHASFNSAAADGETITRVELNVTGANISGSAVVAWNAGVPSVSGLNGGTSISIATTDGHLTSAAYKDFYFLLPASGELSSMTIKAVYGKTGGYVPSETISRKSAMSLVRNKIYPIKGALKGFFSGGDGSENYPYQIATADDFKAIATLANATVEADGNGFNATAKRTFFGSAKVHYVQTAAIDFNNDALTSIGVYNATAADALPFQGTYDGDGKTLSKFTVTGTQAASTGLFEYVDGATLKNITIGRCSVTGENVTGILTGRCIGATTIDGCTLTGPANVEGRNSVGFIAHLNSSSAGSPTVKKCTVSNITVITAVSGADANNQGGVVGFAGGASTIESCSTSGTITFTGTASGAARGGIVGKFESSNKLSNCTNGAEVKNNLEVDYTGGIAGQLTKGTIESCVNTGDVSGEQYVGGIIGQMGSSSAPASGDNICFVKSCRVNASVSATGDKVGGIAGRIYNGSVVSGCFTKGSVTGGSYDIGGLAGVLQVNQTNALARSYMYDCLSSMNLKSNRTSGNCRTGGAVGFVTVSSAADSNAPYARIDNCGVTNVTIDAKGDLVGGFAGSLTGSSSGTSYANRLVIRNCYTLVSSISANSKYGGFVGSFANYGQLTWCYFVASDSNSDISANVTKSNYNNAAADAATCTTFNSHTSYNFNINSVSYTSDLGWAIPSDVTYPVPGALITLGPEYYK